MNKVVIITRVSEYNEDSIFGEAIKEMDQCQYKDRNQAMEHISRSLWIKKMEEVKRDAQIAAASFGLIQYHGEYLEKLVNESEERATEFIVGKLREKMRSPYASFKSSDFEVIMVLPENLMINNDCEIPQISEFLNCVNQDCEITGSDNVLYIHDKQLAGKETPDTTIFNREKNLNLLTTSSISGVSMLKNLEATYKYIALFRHSPVGTSYFHSQILTQKFGQSNLLDILFEIESEFKMDKMEEAFDISQMITKINEQIKKVDV